MREARFKYMFIGDPNTTMPELAAHHGETVIIVRPLRGGGDEYDDEVGPMSRIEFRDGTSGDAFDSELVPVVPTPYRHYVLGDHVWVNGETEAIVVYSQPEYPEGVLIHEVDDDSETWFEYHWGMLWSSPRVWKGGA